MTTIRHSFTFAPRMTLWAALFMSAVAAGVAQEQAPPASVSVPLARIAPPRVWSRIRIPDPGTATIVRHALDDAARRLAYERCQQVLSDFRAADGRPLTAGLETLQVDIREYLRLVLFEDGSQHQSCANALAYTLPGSRVVYVCGPAIDRAWRMNPDHVVFTLIHETLHTLGLGENPPSSLEITRRVRLKCGLAGGVKITEP
jgi:hypothetical protein